MKKTNRGFTLIELMVVIGIIGVLAAMALVNFQDARERARDVQRKADLKAIQQAFELHKNDRIPQVYPATATWKTDLTSNGYIKAIPVDPTFASNPSGWTDYTYTRNASDPLRFTLRGCLENSADPNKDATNTCTTGYSYTLIEP